MKPTMVKVTRNIAITIICILLGVILAWQYKSVNVHKSLASYENKRADQLKDDLIKLQNSNSELRKRLQQAEDENRKFENASITESEIAEKFTKDLAEARIFAGLTDVKGKGVVVTLADSDYYDQVHDEDVLSVLNELRASGAQALAVNDERIIAMSEVREAGKYIMINGKQMVSPFVIKAISDPEKLERSLRLIGGVAERLENDFKLKVDIKRDDNIFIPRIKSDSAALKNNLLTPAD